MSNEKSKEINNKNTIALQYIKEWIKGILIVFSFVFVQFLSSVFMIYFMTMKVAKQQLETYTYMMRLSDMFLAMFIAETLLIIVLIIIYNKKIITKCAQALKALRKFVIKIVVYFSQYWIVYCFQVICKKLEIIKR